MKGTSVMDTTQNETSHSLDALRTQLAQQAEEIALLRREHAIRAARVLSVIDDVPELSYAGNTISRLDVSKYTLRKKVADVLGA